MATTIQVGGVRHRPSAPAQGGSGVSPEALEALRTEQTALQGNIRDLKDKTDKLERMIAGAKTEPRDLVFENEDDVKDLSQGERDLIIATLKRAILAPWLATEEVWGKWWVYDRASSIKKLATPTKEFKVNKGWDESLYTLNRTRFQAVNGGTLVGNFYTLEQAMASITYPMGDLRIYVYHSNMPHAIFDPIPEDASRVSPGHIAFDSGTATLSVLSDTYQLIKDKPELDIELI